jgi:hypothetical protein
MKNLQQATHNHKRAGAVVVLQSTTELAKVLIPASGDEYWVKVNELTELTAGVEESKPSKRESKTKRATA